MTNETCHASAAAETNDCVSAQTRELKLCLCERARGDLGCNCGTIVPPIADRIADLFRELQADLAAIRGAL